MGIKEIPTTAVAVKVTNVTSPSFMKMYKYEAYSDRLNDISEKLRLATRNHRCKELDERIEAKMGDMAIIHNRLETEYEVPAWWCRGIVGHYNNETSKYNIFLVDHGCTIQAHRLDFAIVNRNLIPDDYLSSTIGLYNVTALMPQTVGSNYTIETEVTRKWSERAVRLTQDCISMSKKLYFDYRASGNNNVLYGDLYLVVDDEIVSLSEMLVCNELAICMSHVTMHRKSDTVKKIDLDDGGGVVVELERKTNDTLTTNHARVHDDELDSNDTTINLHLPEISTRSKLIDYAGVDCQQILIHSKVRCERLVTVADARFPRRIHIALKQLPIVALRRIQSYMWPAVTKGLNVLSVGPPSCGKTIGYLVPIISSIASLERIRRDKNPSILILCSSTSDVLNIRTVCCEILDCYTDIRCVAGWNGRPNRSLVADIYNGCQILIVTPPFLMRFINQDDEHRKLISFDNLSHLIIDGIDVILCKYYESLRQLFTRHIVIGNRERQCFHKPPLQVIIVARQWSSLINEFGRQCMTDPYICIGSYMEAIVFARIKPQLYIIESTRKMNKLCELLDDQVLMQKTMIVCDNSQEVLQLNEYLLQNRKILFACEPMTFTEIHDIAECWKATISGFYPILICTDKVLVDLNITDADWLIHYSVALPSKSQFYFRFSVLLKNLRKGQKKCKVTIIVDESNTVQLSGIVDVVKRCGMTLSNEFMDKVQRMAAQLDSRKKTYPICDAVKALGFCRNKSACPYRHCVLAEVDTPITPIKINDSVKLIVTFIHNATHFTARVIEFTSPDNKITKYSAAEYTHLSSKIQGYYADKNNRRWHRKINVGDKCVWEESFDNFQRARILNVVEKDCDDVPTFVEVKCIDTGAIMSRISVTKLLEIPEHLANLDTHILEVFLAGLAPYDDENEWNRCAIDSAHDWFKDSAKPHTFVLGKVRLHLADTLWVDPLEFRTKIIGHPDLVSASLKRHMIRLRHGVSNDEHLPQLYELCRIGMVKTVDNEDVVPAKININSSENEIDSSSS